MFKVLVVSQDEKTAVVSDGTDLELIVPRILPQFFGGEVRLEPGQTFSGVLHGQNQIVDALNEDNTLRAPFMGDEVVDQPASWQPYSNPAPDAGKERK